MIIEYNFDSFRKRFIDEAQRRARHAQLFGGVYDSAEGTENFVRDKLSRQSKRGATQSPAQKVNRNSKKLFAVLFPTLLLVFAGQANAQAPSGIPVFAIDKTQSNVKFHVDASVAIDGAFKQWDASMTFTSTDISTAVFSIKIDAASVDTGSGMKNNKLKGNDFFDAKKDPYITFKSTKIVQTGPTTFEVNGDFTIRGVTKQEKLQFDVTGKGTGSGTLTGTMAFDRKQYGMNSGIPFIKIANRVAVTVFLKGRRVSGPPPAFKQ